MSGVDVTGTLGWGIRRYAWLIALFVLALGIVVPAALSRAPAVYEARALVGPVKTLRVQNLDVLPRLGTDVFRAVPGSREVRNAAGVPASEELRPEQVELVVAQDNIVFTVVGRDSDPEVARDLANVAASRFVTELNIYSQSVGSFSVSRLATVPTDPVPRLAAGPQAWGLGILAGLLGGLGTVALLLLVTRPVIDPVTAADLTGSPVLGRITLGRHDRPVTGMTQVSHRLLTQPAGMVLLVGGPATRRARRELASELTRWLRRVRRVIVLGSAEPVADYGTASLVLPGFPDVLFVLADASPVEVATRPQRSLTLLVVREGTSRAELVELAHQYLDGENAAVLLVRRASWVSRLLRRVSGESPEQRSRREGFHGTRAPRREPGLAPVRRPDDDLDPGPTAGHVTGRRPPDGPGTR